MRPAAFLLIGVLSALSAFGLEIAVKCDPELPAKNVLDGRNANGKEGPIFVKKGDENPYRGYPIAAFKPGVKYVASCRIKPSPEVSTKALPGAGLGFSLTFWDKSWKKAVSVSVRGEGSGEWKTIVGEPVELADWIAVAQLTAGLSYSPGEGWVDNLCVVPATARLRFGARSAHPIRQVKVLDENDAPVYDSGVLEGAMRDFRHELEVNAAHNYTVLAIDASGDVAARSYPHEH